MVKPVIWLTVTSQLIPSQCSPCDDHPGGERTLSGSQACTGRYGSKNIKWNRVKPPKKKDPKWDNHGQKIGQSWIILQGFLDMAANPTDILKKTTVKSHKDQYRDCYFPLHIETAASSPPHSWRDMLECQQGQWCFRRQWKMNMYVYNIYIHMLCTVCYWFYHTWNFILVSSARKNRSWVLTMFGLQMLKCSLFEQFRWPKFPPSLIEVVGLLRAVE
jgi:hypothetical protein